MVFWNKITFMVKILAFYAVMARIFTMSQNEFLPCHGLKFLYDRNFSP